MVDDFTRRDVVSLIGSTPFVVPLGSTESAANTTATNTSWPVFGGDASNTKYKSGDAGPSHGISESWSLTLNEHTGSRGDEPVTYPHPIVAEQTLFIDGSALNIADGTTRWTADWDATPCYHDTNLITHDGDQIVARDSRDGSKIYEKETAEEPLHLSVIGDVLYTVPRDEHTAVLTTRDAHTGDVISKVRTIEEDEEDDEFFYRSEFPPILSENTALIRYDRRAKNSILWRTGYLVAIDTETGVPRWTTQERHEWPASIANGTVFSVGNYNGIDHSMYAHEAVSGNRKWRYEYEHGELTGPAVTENHVVVGLTDTETGGIRSVDPVDGTEQWATELAPAATVPIVVGDQALIGTEQGTIVAVSLESGDVRWETETERGLHRSSLCVGHGRLVVSAKNGGISIFSDIENTAPEAVIEYEPTSPVVGETVRFDALGSDDEHEIETYNWQFSGVKSFDTDGPVVERSFDTAGDVDATLQVTDEFGKSDETTTTLPILQPHEQPTAEFVYTPSNPVIDEEIRFDASGSEAYDGSIVSYEWDFGNGFTDNNEVTEHTFNQSGEHTVNLRVRDDKGLKSTRQQIVEVNPESVNVSITASETTVEVDDTTNVVYSISNFVTSDELTVQLLVDTPSDVSITGVSGAEEGSNQFTAVATLPPSRQDNIRVQLTPNAAGTHAISAIADYFFEDNQNDSERKAESLTITAVEPTDDGTDDSTDDGDVGSDETDDEAPGFGVPSAIASLGGAGYLLRRRLSDTDTDTE